MPIILWLSQPDQLTTRRYNFGASRQIAALNRVNSKRFTIGHYIHTGRGTPRYTDPNKPTRLYPVDTAPCCDKKEHRPVRRYRGGHRRIARFTDNRRVFPMKTRALSRFPRARLRRLLMVARDYGDRTRGSGSSVSHRAPRAKRKTSIIPYRCAAIGMPRDSLF